MWNLLPHVVLGTGSSREGRGALPEPIGTSTSHGRFTPRTPECAHDTHVHTLHNFPGRFPSHLIGKETGPETRTPHDIPLRAAGLAALNLAQGLNTARRPGARGRGRRRRPGPRTCRAGRDGCGLALPPCAHAPRPRALRINYRQAGAGFQHKSQMIGNKLKTALFH